MSIVLRTGYLLLLSESELNIKEINLEIFFVYSLYSPPYFTFE